MDTLKQMLMEEIIQYISTFCINKRSNGVYNRGILFFDIIQFYWIIEL